MNAIEWSKRELAKKGWGISEINYERPSSGFKCIEGGYFCQLSTTENDWDMLDEINVGKIFGFIGGTGIITALYKDDFIALIKIIPQKQQ